MATKTKEKASKNGKITTEAPVQEAEQVVTGKPIVLPQLALKVVRIRIIGDEPLIVHAWSDKAKKQMLDKQMGVATQGREHKNPRQDYENSCHIIERRNPFEDSVFGFPAVGFKSAAVTACTSLGKSITKVAARQAFHVSGAAGGLVVIEGRPQMREDMVRIGMGTADIRYRAEFPEWATTLTIRYNSRVLTDEQICNLFNTAGFAVGIGEWRTEKNGINGAFHVG